MTLIIRHIAGFRHPAIGGLPDHNEPVDLDYLIGEKPAKYPVPVLLDLRPGIAAAREALAKALRGDHDVSDEVGAAIRAQALEDLTFLQSLKDDGGMLLPKLITGNRWAAIMPLLYTNAIVSGRMGHALSYDDRWCYHGFDAAKRALESWNGEGEPQGWHRHPPSGRRRPDGDASREYVAR